MLQLELTLLEDPDQLQDALERYSPQYVAAHVEPLSTTQVWGYLETSQGQMRAFMASYGLNRVWTVSPVYTV